MRVFLFILLAILVGSCSTTKEYDCDYSDYKTISLEDFKWYKKADYDWAIIMKGDTVLLKIRDTGLYKDFRNDTIYRIDALSGDFLDSTDSKESAHYYCNNYPIDYIPCGIKYFLNAPFHSCINQLNIIFGASHFIHRVKEKDVISIEIDGKITKIDGKIKDLVYTIGRYKFKLNETEIWNIRDFALYEGCYLLVTMNVNIDESGKPSLFIGLLDLQKLINNFSEYDTKAFEPDPEFSEKYMVH